MQAVFSDDGSGILCSVAGNGLLQKFDTHVLHGRLFPAWGLPSGTDKFTPASASHLIPAQGLSLLAQRSWG